jgi:hypothetical protein
MATRKLVEDLRQSRITRRQFIIGASALGLSLPAISSLLTSCATNAPAPPPTSALPKTTAAPVASPTSTALARRKLGKVEPIAKDYDGAFRLWNEKYASAGRPEDIALTDEEKAKVKAMKLRIGSMWMTLSSVAPRYTAMAVESRCKELDIEPITVSHGGETPNRELVTARMFLNEKVDAVVGIPSHGFGVHEAVKSLYEAGIPVFSTYRPFGSYYPTICTLSGNTYQSGAAALRELAKKIASAGYTTAKVAQIQDPYRPESCW